MKIKRRTANNGKLLNPFAGSKQQNLRGWQIVLARRDVRASNKGFCPSMKKRPLIFYLSAKNDRLKCSLYSLYNFNKNRKVPGMLGEERILIEISKELVGRLIKEQFQH